MTIHNERFDKNDPYNKGFINGTKSANTTQNLYNELIMAVGKKYPNETRHETALRYIKQAELPDNQCEKEA